jgi:hypothetical protein
VEIRAWKSLYNTALRSEPESFLGAQSIAVRAILDRMIFLTLNDLAVTAAKVREKRALYIALSDLGVLREAFNNQCFLLHVR